MVQSAIMQQSRISLASTAAFAALLLVLAGAAVTVQAQDFVQEEGPEGVPNYTRVDATVACAGATGPEAMPEIQRRGFRTVINFRTAGERNARVVESQAAAEEAGLNYVHLPFREPTTELVEQFLDTVAEPANQPVYIHCGSANRVGFMWLIKRVKQDGYSLADATTEAEAIGLRSDALRAFALDYLGSN